MQKIKKTNIGPLQQRWMFNVFRNLRIKFSKFFGLIVSHMERINTRKMNTINIVQGSKSSKIMILSKITFILFEC